MAEALANLTGTGEDGLLKDLQRMARKRTAEADVVLDENGKPVDVGPVSNRSTAPAVDNGDTLTSADTVVVRENEPEDVAEDLFESNSNNANGSRHRPRGKRRKS